MVSPSNHYTRIYRRLAQLFGTIVIMVSTLVLIGSLFNWPWEYTLFPLIPPRPVIIIALFAGVALLLMSDPATETRTRWLRGVILGAIILNAVHAVWLQPSPAMPDNRLLTFFYDTALQLENFTGRMAPLTLWGLALVTLTLGLLDVPRHWAQCAAEILALIIILASMLGLFGLLVDPRSLDRLPLYSHLSFASALLLTLLGGGLLTVHAGQGLTTLLCEEGPGGAMSRRLMPLALLLPFVLEIIRLRGESWGLLSSTMGVVIGLYLHIFLFATIFWFTARTLNRHNQERHQAEQALREAHQELQSTYNTLQQTTNRFNGMLAGTRDLVAAMDLNGRFITFNRAYADELEWLCGRKIMLDMPLHDLLDLTVAGQKNIFQAWERSRSGEEYTSTVEIDSLGGQHAYYEINSSAIHDGQGAVVGCTHIVRNITERRQTIEELRRQRDFTTAILNTAGSLVVVLDRLAKIVSFNRACECLTDYRADEVIGQSIDLFLDETEAPLLHDEYKHLVAGRFPDQLECVWINRHGERRTIAWNNTCLTDDQGAVEFIICAGIDVTDNKHAEQALREANSQLAQVNHHLIESEKRFATLVEATFEALFIGDQGRVADVNEPFCQLFGYTRAEALALTPAQLIGDEDREYLVKRVDQHLENSGEFHYVKKDGTIFLAETHGRTIQANGRIVRVTALRDITARNQAEQELRRTANDLARSNADLEQFAYVASHDLQEPLRAVAGCVQILRMRYQTQMGQGADELIEHAVSGVKRMQTLIEDLLSYSRIGRGTPAALIDSAQVTAMALANLREALRESGAQVHIGDLPRLEIDATLFMQLMQNLIGNAIKFHGEKPLQIDVSAQYAPGAWTFAVSDNGIGIKAQQFERIFMLFQRLHSRQAYPGTGIGLAVCKKIVENHGGRIWVESQPGQGSTFKFTLPTRRS